MDDLTITTTSVPECRWILQGLERLMTSARMSFKPSKWKVINKLRFSISGTVIPTITEQPVKSLGKLFDSNLRDSAAIQKSTTELGTWVAKVDKSGLPGRFTVLDNNKWCNPGHVSVKHHFSSLNIELLAVSFFFLRGFTTVIERKLTSAGADTACEVINSAAAKQIQQPSHYWGLNPLGAGVAYLLQICFPVTTT